MRAFENRYRTACLALLPEIVRMETRFDRGLQKLKEIDEEQVGRIIDNLQDVAPVFAASGPQSAAATIEQGQWRL